MSAALIPRQLKHSAAANSAASFAQLRPRIESAIDRLLSVLDAMDGDPDLEGYTVYSPRTENVCPDLEDDDEREIDLDLTEGARQRRPRIWPPVHSRRTGAGRQRRALAGARL